MIGIVLLLIIIIWSLYYYSIQYGRYGRFINCIPGLSGVPMIGNVADVYHRSLEDLWILMRQVCKKYYPITKVWSFTFAYVSIRHPDDIQKILSSTNQHLGKGFLYTFLHPWLGTGLLTSKGAKWRTRRKILTPSFHFNMLKQYVDILIEEGNRMAKSAQDIKDSNIQDLESFIGQHTLNAICETAMGISLRNMGNYQQQYIQAVHDMGKILVYRVTKPWFYFDSIFALTSMGRKQIKSLKILHGFTEKVITERRQHHERSGWQYLKDIENDSASEIDDRGATEIRRKRLSMMDLLLAASRNNELSNLEIREEVDTFMFEGHDTTSLAICYAILLLAEHKEVQNCVRKEVHAVMQENAGNLTMTALNSMSYLERCLKESLRLYPSVPFIMRVLSEDVKLHSYLVPLGSVLHINIHDLHRDPNFWPNPDVFDPDRFLPEQSLHRHPFCYVPFSAGPRNCIGQRFAMLEMKAAIAPLVHDFYLEPIDYLKNLRFKVDVVNRVSHPIRVRFVPIERMQPSDAKS